MPPKLVAAPAAVVPPVTIPFVPVVVLVRVPPVERLLLFVVPPLVLALPPLCTPVVVELLEVDELPPLAVAPPNAALVLLEAEVPPVLSWPPAEDAPPVNSTGLGEGESLQPVAKAKVRRIGSRTWRTGT